MSRLLNTKEPTEEYFKMPRNEYNGIVLGPLLEEDKLFLQAIIRMTNPMVLIEFGYLWGHSAQAMLDVMDPTAVLHSYDYTKNPTHPDPRFKFHMKSQEEVEGIENIDFVFIDASHDFELNKITLIKLMDHLSDKAIIAVHDTGTWPSNVFDTDHGETRSDGRFVHCPGEVKFVNWVATNFPIFQVIHFHCDNQVRHGITLLQKYTTA